jgi:Ca-activated chloride channel family protein
MVAVTFTNPTYLLFLFVIPFIILFHFVSLKTRRTQALKFANFDAVARIKGIDFFSKNIIVLGITCLIVFSLVFSLAGTVLELNKSVGSSSFVIAIDASRSMEATDFSPNRMEAAKSTAAKFVDEAPLGTRMGVISFAGNSLIEERVTEDKTLIKEAIKGINVTFTGGTDVYNALLTSVILLENEENKAVILLSDGQITIGDFEQAVQYAQKNNIVIHTIGIGTLLGGNTTYGLSKLDADTLNSLATNTKGKYFSAENADQLQQSFRDILDIRVRAVSLPVSRYLLIFALLLLGFEYILINTRFRVFP